MDAYEVTRAVYSRVQAIEPDHASKIMGYLLLQDGGDEEMFRLAFSHEAVLQALVMKVKKDLGLLPATGSVRNIPQFVGAGQQHSLLQPVISSDVANLYVNGQDDRFVDQAFLQSSIRFNSNGNGRLGFQERQDHLLRGNEIHHMPMYNESVDNYGFDDYGLQYADAGKLSFDNLHRQLQNRRFSSHELSAFPDMASPWKPCLYYARGYCKHGSGCKFLHIRPGDGHAVPLSSNGSLDSGSDDGVLTSSLERLEIEILELLRGRKAPVSIAALPQLYYERFGKTLQADGYLTESQRHGKAGYSLTKLLARMKNSVVLIDRPHGQHAVVAAEDAFKFDAYRAGEKDDLSGYNPGSRQIYLTFPADSAFTEEDVSSYFRIYGPVQDVRIPFQQKRMFGFVTFVYPETVKMILGKGNPHFICGARVLVKPYKEKGNKHSDRKLSDHSHLGFFTADSTGIPLAGPQQQLLFENEVLRRQFEQQELVMEFEKLRFADPRLQHEQFSHLWKQHHQQHTGEVVFPLPQDAFSNITSSSSSTTVSIPISQSLERTLSQTGSDGNSPSEKSVVSSEGLKPIQTANGNGNLKGTPGNHSQEDFDQNVKHRSDKSSDEHNLPDSPFTSPHKPFSAFTSDKSTIDPLPFVIPSQSAADNSNCHICNDFCLDPLHLDCGHAFCFECINKVVRVSRDGCPVCHQDIGSRVMKLIELRRAKGGDCWY